MVCYLSFRCVFHTLIFVSLQQNKDFLLTYLTSYISFVFRIQVANAGNW